MQVSQFILHVPETIKKFYKQVEQKKTVKRNDKWKHILLLCISFLYCAAELSETQN